MKKIAFTFLFVLFSLISSFSQITEEFTLPYPVEVFDLDQSGPKYFCMNRDFYDYIDTLYFYNPNYSLHKKFEIIGKNKMIYNYSDIKNISENIFNTDDNIEILYFRGDSLKVINENQEILFREYVYASQHFSFYTIKENKHKFKYRYTEDGRYKFAVYNAMNIELEHVYDSANNVVLVNFKFSGEKYVAYNKYCNKVGIFNLDHTLFKEIDLSFTSYSLMDIYEIDNNGTYSYNLSFSSSSNGVYTSYIYNENGDLLAEFNDSQSAVCYNLKTGERKILTSGTPTNSYTAVYNENFEFEKKYDYHSIYKYTDIEFHGEKLCFSDVANNTYYIYNIDNTIFKKIDLNVIYDYGTPDDDLITTHFFNSDDKIEIVYYDNDTYSDNFRCIIMNEDSEELYSFNNNSVKLYNIEDSKILITRESISYFNYISKIYKVTSLTSSELISSEATLELYPNPTYSHVNLKLESEYNGQVQVQIYSINGVKISETKFQKHNQSITKSVNLNKLESGTYLIKIQIGNDIFTKKLLRLL